MAINPTSGTYHEVEIKLDADPGFELPELTGLPGVRTVQAGEAHELQATYLDTADLRLATHGTTFRRRTGGSDAGWHLKLPATRTGRLEVRRACGEGVHDVPESLLAVVRVQLRGEPVAPVARISTTRTVRRLVDEAGLTLAEVADDHVQAEALGEPGGTASWREIEVELIEGDETLLSAASALLIGAGARPGSSSSKLQRALALRLAPGAATEPPPAPGSAGKRRRKASGPPSAARPAGEVVIEYLAAHLSAMLAQDPQVRLDTEDSIHQMRVATRRLRAALASFRPLFARDRVERLREDLKWLAGDLGTARDAEVIRARLRQDIAAQPPELVIGPVLRRVDLELGRTYRDAHAQVLSALDSDRYLALVEALESFVAVPPFTARASEPAAVELRARVRKACARVAEAVAVLAGSEPHADRDHRMHEVRIAAKRARYAAETARPVAGRKAVALADAMTAVQETLGDHQDAVVEAGWLRDLAVRAHLAGENAFTFGRLHGLTQARAAHDEAEFAAVWAAARRVLAGWPG